GLDNGFDQGDAIGDICDLFSWDYPCIVAPERTGNDGKMVGQPGLEPFIQFEIRIGPFTPFAVGIGDSVTGGNNFVSKPQEEKGECPIHLVEVDPVITAGEYGMECRSDII